MVGNIGGLGGYCSNLLLYCGAAFDRAKDILSLSAQTEGRISSLLVWTSICTGILKQRDDILKDSQLLVVLSWERQDNLLMIKCDNVSSSLGFEELGLYIY